MNKAQPAEKAPEPDLENLTDGGRVVGCAFLF